MKKPVIFLVAVVFATSCSNNAEKNTSAEQSANPQELQLKEQNEGIERAKQAMLDSVNLSNIKQRTIDSMNAVAASRAEETHGGSHHLSHHAAAAHPVAPAVSTSPVVNSGNAVSTPAGTSNTTAAATTTTATKKKGINNAVKGSLIGLGTGVAAGAVLDKNNRGQGAILGGVIGAVGGAIGGAVIDKHKKKKAEEDSTANQK